MSQLKFVWAVIAVLALGTVGYFLYVNRAAAPDDALTGGDRDAHGCIGSAGYTWCEARQECLRPFESYCTATAPKTAVFACAGAKSIAATFYPGDDKYVDLTLSDGRKLSVPRAISASGARYANADESFVFWNKGDTAFVTEKDATTFPDCAIAEGYKNAAYTIEGKSIRLVNGYAETSAAPGSAAKLITKYFGDDASGDLNGDGAPDVAFILTQTSGGSGTFYYVVAAQKTPNGYTGTNGVLLGDRIAPQTIEIRNGEVVANYADRPAGAPMTNPPSVGVSKYLHLEKGQLVIISGR